jgi:amino acid transporter
MLKIRFPDTAYVDHPWFHWALVVLTLTLFVLVPNVTSPYAMLAVLRSCMVTSTILIAMYTIWFPVVSAPNYAFHPDLILIFDNWINWGTMIYAEDRYAWVVAAIFPAWIFKGFEVSMHLSEETKQASKSVATGMWTGALVTYLIGIPVLVLMVACINDIRILINASRFLPHAFAEYLVQVVGRNAAMGILILAWIDAALATAVLFMSAQRLTFALARDEVLLKSAWIRQVSKRKLPVNAGIVVFAYGILLSMVGVSSTSSFQALLAIAVIAQNLSYSIVIFARLTYGRETFKPGSWNLGSASVPLNVIALVYTLYIFMVLISPFWFPVEAVSAPRVCY